MPVKVSHTIDLGPDLPNEVMDIAREQGENPDRVCADIQELRDMIFGKINEFLQRPLFIRLLFNVRCFVLIICS